MLEPDRFERLLASIREGDSAACSEFVQTFRPIVSKLAADALTGNRLQGPYDQSDIAQSVVFNALEVVRRSYPVHGPGAMYSLLRIMVTRKIISLSRMPENRIRRESHPFFAQQMSLAVSSDKSPSEFFGDAFDLEAIVALLSPENQRVFALCCEGKTFAEIAEILGGKNPHAVRVSYKRDLNRISRLLDAEDPSD